MSQAAALDAFWMPFSSNKNFKGKPRMLVSAKDMHYQSDDGRDILDATSGLWCCNAGHCREPIAKAIAQQAATLDFAPTFQMGHPAVFEYAQRLAAEIFPAPLTSLFFTNSGSEAVDSALKIALAWQKVRGQPAKTRFIGRERAYHGVNFGGISVGGIVKNKMWFNNQLPQVSHLPHTQNLEKNAFSRGLPPHGGQERAAALENIIALHDASNIAAVIVEPVSGSSGVLVPPVDYLRHLRDICDRHDILLIFDEVITAFGRLGAPTAAQRFDVMPDMITFAKGCTNGAMPMGGVAVRQDIYQTFLDAAAGDSIDFFHGYTYSGHPMAAAAGLASLDVYRDEDLLNQKDGALEKKWEDGLHQLREASENIIDIRNIGMMGAVELRPRENAPGMRAFEVFLRCFHEKNLLTRVTADTLAFSPPLIAKEEHIDAIVNRLGEALAEVD